MKDICPVCGQYSESIDDPQSSWCADCTAKVLTEQKSEDTRRVKPQVFHA